MAAFKTHRQFQGGKIWRRFPSTRRLPCSNGERQREKRPAGAHLHPRHCRRPRVSGGRWRPAVENGRHPGVRALPCRQKVRRGVARGKAPAGRRHRHSRPPESRLPGLDLGRVGRRQVDPGEMADEKLGRRADPDDGRAGRPVQLQARSWALLVFFKFFQTMSFCIFCQVNLTGCGLFKNRTGAEVGYELDKNAKKIIFHY